MTPPDRPDEIIARTVYELCRPESYGPVYHRPSHDAFMPSIEEVGSMVELVKTVLFPGYYSDAEMTPETMPFVIGASLSKVQHSLSEQIKRGTCFACSINDEESCLECEQRAFEKARTFIAGLPGMRSRLATDVQAAFEGDPAAVTPAETIFCYPSIKAIAHYRIAHELYLLGVELIPRIITEMAHSLTGIDIHPGAVIGESFFIDHGTGVVIGETCVIGDRVRLYQAVTLGARSFPKDERGRLVKGIPRHPVVEDDVIIYAGTTILGRVTIGRGAIIGGNVWLTHDVAPGARVVQSGQQDEL